MEDKEEVVVEEVVVLSKFDGDTTAPEAETERLTVKDGYVVSHDVIEQGEVVGPVEGSTLVGTDIGRLIELEQEVE